VSSAGVRPAAHVCETRSVAAVAGHALLALASLCRTASRPWSRAHRAQRRAKRVGSASASRSAATASGRPPTSSQPRGPAAAPASARVTPQLAAGAKPSRAAARSAALTCSPPGASLHGLSLHTLLHGGALAQPCEQCAAGAAISTQLVRRCSLMLQHHVCMAMHAMECGCAPPSLAACSNTAIQTSNLLLDKISLYIRKAWNARSTAVHV